MLICISVNNVESLSNYQDDDSESKNPFIPDSFYPSKNINSRAIHSIAPNDYELPYGQVHVIPFKKRTIPIELQKALYAHGIVGRRR